jgi:hypothetical protein
MHTPELLPVKTMLVAVLSGGVVAAALVGLLWAVVGNASRSVDSAPPSQSGVAGGRSQAGAESGTDTGLQAPTVSVEPSASPTSTVSPSGGTVNPSVSELGLVPEPITTDPVAYGIEAARALVSFDTTRVSRNQFAAYIATWLGNDPRYGRDSALMRDAHARKTDVIFSRIIGNTERWTALGVDKSVLTAVQTGVAKIDYDHVEPDPQEIRTLISSGFHLVTIELNVTTTAVQGGQPIAIIEPLLVTMQINCRGSLPAAKSVQVSGDCKVIQYMTEPTL